jgi:hypothetical protein
VEIKEAKQNENPDVQLFDFTLNAEFAPPATKPVTAPTPQQNAPARKG